MTEPDFTRPEVPVWRQALEGVALVAVLTAIIALGGFVIALIASLLF